MKSLKNLYLERIIIMNKIIDILGKEIEFECMGCDIANHKLIPPGGYVYEDNFYKCICRP